MASIEDDIPAEYQKVDIDLAHPETIPWFDDCRACDIRKEFAAREDDNTESWLADLGEHFWERHKIVLHQHRGSKNLGRLVPLTGPFTRTQWAVRYRVVDETSPIRGQVSFESCLTRALAEVHVALFAERPHLFDQVVIVSRQVTVTEWREVE